MKYGMFLGGLVFCAVFFAGCSWSFSDFTNQSGLQVFTTHNEPAQVFLDGKLLGSTPYRSEHLSAGYYTLEVRPNNQTLIPYKDHISLRKGIITVFTWKPSSEAENSGGVVYEAEKNDDPTQSALSITTVPDGAIIHVDGQLSGFSPTVLTKVEPGQHEYEVTLPSFETQKNTIQVLPGYRMLVHVYLARQIFDNMTKANQ